MATAHFAQMGAAPNLIKSDLDMNSLFDFDQTAARPPVARAASSARVFHDDDQVFAGPSHEYDRFPQQTGVVAGDVRNLASINQPFAGPDFGGFNSGIDDGGLWDVDSDLNMDMSNPAIFDKFVDPSYIEAEEPQSHVGRLWPGMHQQAALAKAQQAPPRQFVPHNKGKGRVVQPLDNHTEESISRLLSHMRHQNNLSSVQEEDDVYTPGMSGSGRSKKDEEDMDDDERLLASEEGKKLSSKERRQLRNKVSARAFRSRRKEYIGQLEGEVAQKAQEVNSLKTENNSLTEENARYRALIQTLLRHPSFTPFIEDLSKDPAFIASQQHLSQGPSRRSATPAQQQPQQGRQRVSVNMSDAPVDLSMLNIGNNAAFAAQQQQQQQQQGMAFDFSQPQMFPGQMEQPRQGSFF